MDSDKKVFIYGILILVLYTALAFFLWRLLLGYLTTNFFQDFLSKTGFLAPFVMFIIQIFQVLLAPIPVQPVSIAAGYIFGPWLGFAIAYCGLLFGSLIAFFLGKYFGRPLVMRVVSKRIMKKYDGSIQKVSVFIVALIFFFPFFPDDEIIYILGMSKTKLKKLLLPLIIGKTGGASTAILGVGLKNYPQYTVHIILITLLVTGLAFYYRHKLERGFNWLIKKFGTKN